MVPHLCLGVILLAASAAGAAAAAANPDIQVVCNDDSVSITWKISAELVPNAARLFLGTCMSSRLNVMPTGEGEAQFNYPLADCKFKKMIQRKYLIYRNELTYRPHNRSKPPAYMYPIQCVYERLESWHPPFLNPGAGTSKGRGSLIFHLELLNEQLTGLATTNIIPLGSLMPIWATVEQNYHQPLLLLMEECVAATTRKLQPHSHVYPIIGNNGCLLESQKGNAVFLPRYHSSALILYMQSFKFGLGQEVYIHCKLVAWDPEGLDENNKACHYVKETGRWDLLDDPSQSSLCSCCGSTCRSRSKRGVSQEPQYNSVLGPLMIVDPSDSETLNLPAGSVVELDRVPLP